MSHIPDARDPRIAAAIGRYRKKNVIIMAVLLFIWAAVGLGAGILFADALNALHLARSTRNGRTVDRAARTGGWC
ncbi:MAG: hypothetical protein BMS9Abin05_1853 [Rhodothermia bacterium]|nr:MAG: hypothetical protein BMS9Abin05_1853 [Rhodothermia bacterium]